MPSSAAARSTRPARGAADRPARRPPARSCPTSRSAWNASGGTRSASGRARVRLPRPGDPDRLRRALPGLRSRLLRLLRAARDRQRRRPRPLPPVVEGRAPADVGRLFAGFTAYAEPFRSVVDRARRVAPDRVAAGATAAEASRTMHDTAVASRPRARLRRRRWSPGSRARVRSGCASATAWSRRPAWPSSRRPATSSGSSSAGPPTRSSTSWPGSVGSARSPTR